MARDIGLWFITSALIYLSFNNACTLINKTVKHLIFFTLSFFRKYTTMNMDCR